MAEKQHVFLVGAKSLGAYGGYETFIDKLTEYHQDNKNIQYHVAVKANGQGHMDETKVDAKIISGSRFIYHNADSQHKVSYNRCVPYPKSECHRRLQQ